MEDERMQKMVIIEYFMETLKQEDLIYLQKTDVNVSSWSTF